MRKLLMCTKLNVHNEHSVQNLRILIMVFRVKIDRFTDILIRPSICQNFCKKINNLKTIRLRYRIWHSNFICNYM